MNERVRDGSCNEGKSVGERVGKEAGREFDGGRHTIDETRMIHLVATG